MTPTHRRLVGALVVAGCLLTACSSTAEPPTTTATPATTTTIAGQKTPAETLGATLRANMTALMTSGVYLTAVATSATITGADPAPSLAAVATNSGQLADLVTNAFGPGIGKQFGQQWSAQTALFVGYARAKAANDTAGADQAKSQLAAFASNLAVFFAASDVYVTASSLATSELTPYVSAVLGEIDAQAAKSTTQYSLLVTAANLMPHIADVFADAIAKALPATRYPGTVTGTAANLRALLTSALVSHTYLAAIMTATTIGGGDVAAPAATLEANSEAIENVISSVYGDIAGRQFLTLWQSYIGFIGDYAHAVVAGDAAGAAKARAELTTFSTTLGTFFAGVVAQLPAATVTADTSASVQGLLAVIDAQAAKSPTQFDLLRQAALTMPTSGDLISEAIAVQFPTRFLP
jgi:hypothetical protein